MDNLQVALKFIDHGIQNLARLHNIRHILYGLYFAMLAAFMPIYLSNIGKQEIQFLLLIAAIIGQGLLVMQIIISLLIRFNYDGLNAIFNAVPFIEKLNCSTDKFIKSHPFIFHKYYPLRQPFSIGLSFLAISNLVLLIWFAIERKNCWLALLCIAIILGPIAVFVFYFRPINKAYDTLKFEIPADHYGINGMPVPKDSAKT